MVQQKLEEPKFLRHQAQREWREIHDGTMRFDRVAVEVAALRAVTLQQLLAFYQVPFHTPIYSMHEARICCAPPLPCPTPTWIQYA